MLAVHCRDLGCEGCGFIAVGESMEQVQEAMFVHACVAHPHLTAGLTDHEREDVRRAIRGHALVAYGPGPRGTPQGHELVGRVSLPTGRRRTRERLACA
jgi:predicted small metal-binding protein